jgi:hypothetical protein
MTTSSVSAAGPHPSVSPPDAHPDADVHAETVRELTALFTKSLRRLGQAGEVEEANRLGGQAFVLLMRRAPDAAERVNGAMHYLARLPQQPPTTTEETASCH